MGNILCAQFYNVKSLIMCVFQSAVDKFIETIQSAIWESTKNMSQRKLTTLWKYEHYF